jgi:hypothetical protein
LSATDNCVDSSPDFKYGRLLNWFRLNIGLWSSTTTRNPSGGLADQEDHPHDGVECHDTSSL